MNIEKQEVNYYIFEYKDSAMNLVEVTISIKNNLYFTKCTCSIYDVKRCKHINSIIAGKTENLTTDGISLQTKLIFELKQLQAGLYFINSTRSKAGTPPFCEKCREEMEPIPIKLGFFDKIFSKHTKSKEYICIKCNRKNIN